MPPIPLSTRLLLAWQLSAIAVTVLGVYLTIQYALLKYCGLPFPPRLALLESAGVAWIGLPVLLVGIALLFAATRRILLGRYEARKRELAGARL